MLPMLLVAAAPLAPPLSAAEVIRQQDAAGHVRVVREVAEDAGGNCVNHGLWQEFAVDGRLVAEGHYDMGRRTGAWRRWLDATAEAPSLAPTLEGFIAPFVSEAEFAAGQLHGQWLVSDALGRPCLAITFAGGERHGDLQQWNPDGRLVCRETYRHGLLDGETFDRDAAEQRLTHAANYVRGYRVVRGTAYLADGSGRRRCEGDFLVGPQTVAAADDFWESRLAEFAHGDECIPHGLWRHWHPKGQLAASGRYEWGRPEGDFVWRHDNGQKAAAGSYAAGQPSGAWRWWNADGLQTAARTLETPAATAQQSNPASPAIVR
jgi:antitoxin component YwqK of YwqJK toxin-antitoxin module